MKKIIALAGAASALTIVSTANAASSIGSTNDQFSITIQGTVPGYCTLAGSGTFTVSNASFAPSGKAGSLQITNLGTAGGVVEAVSATGSFQLSANESCNISLVSSNGGLVNQQNTSANKISYSAVVYDAGSVNALTAVPAAPNTNFSAFNSQFNATTLGNETFSFGFSIPAGSSPVAAGTYQDTLTVIVNPNI